MILTKYLHNNTVNGKTLPSPIGQQGPGRGSLHTVALCLVRFYIYMLEMLQCLNKWVSDQRILYAFNS